MTRRHDLKLKIEDLGEVKAYFLTDRQQVMLERDDGLRIFMPLETADDLDVLQAAMEDFLNLPRPSDN